VIEGEIGSPSLPRVLRRPSCDTSASRSSRPLATRRRPHIERHYATSHPAMQQLTGHKRGLGSNHAATHMSQQRFGRQPRCSSHEASNSAPSRRSKTMRVTRQRATGMRSIGEEHAFAVLGVHLGAVRGQVLLAHLLLELPVHSVMLLPLLLQREDQLILLLLQLG